MKAHRRPIGQPGGLGPSAQHVGKLVAECVIKGWPGALSIHRVPNRPARVIYPVLDRRAVTLAGIAPFAMCEKILEAARDERLARSLGFDA